MSAPSFEITTCSGPSDAWDTFVASRPGDVYSQSSAYADVKSRTHQSQRVEVRCGSDLVGGMQLLTRELRPFGWIGYVPKGPVLIDDSSELAQVVLDAGIALAKRERIRVLVVQPVAAVPDIDAALAARGFGPSPAQVATSGTIEVDLSPSDDALLAAMRSGLRRNIRKAERAQVHVRLGTRDELPLFHQMHLETAKRNGFNPVSWERMAAEWEHLHHRGYLQLFFSEHEGTLLSGATVTAFGDRTLFRHAGWFRSSESANLRPNDLLHWRIMQWSKSNGYRFYDFGGFDRDMAARLLRGEEPPADFRKTYSQFKLGYGGTPTVLPRSVWRVTPALIRPFQSAVKWGLETVPPARRALERRHNAT